MLANCLYVTVVWMSKVLFCNRVVNIWNSLSATVEDFASIGKFKSLLVRLDFSRYENV